MAEGFFTTWAVFRPRRRGGVVANGDELMHMHAAVVGERR